MIVSPVLLKQYPQLAMWICNNIPKVTEKPKVFSAFQKYAGSKPAAQAIRHKTDPQIEYRIIPADNGQFMTKYPDTVFIAKDICDRFEGSDEDAKDPRMHLLLESSLLHEMVHWADWLDRKFANDEIGKAFEKEAYGKDVRRYWGKVVP
jgi:hypothetical protein